jgi:hypothetical protein
MSRKEEQRKINDLYANGEIDREEWSRRFDELSSNRWNAEGPVLTQEQKEKIHEPIQ